MTGVTGLTKVDRIEVIVNKVNQVNKVFAHAVFMAASWNSFVHGLRFDARVNP